jgi:hypothetical protein
MRNEITPSTDARPADINALTDAIRVLSDELRATRFDMQRQRRRIRALGIVLACALAVAGWLALGPAPPALADRADGAQAESMSVRELEHLRAELIARLPEETQRELRRFEQEVDWLSSYLRTWDRDKAGAVVAIMLFRMAQSMNTMPSMEQQMRTMSAQMGALPAIVAELSQINAKMHVITASMDSTMGRAGRMMPWLPFSP